MIGRAVRPGSAGPDSALPQDPAGQEVGGLKGGEVGAASLAAVGYQPARVAQAGALNGIAGRAGVGVGFGITG